MTKHMSFVTESVSIKKPRAAVFAALSQADQLVRWFPTRAEADPRPGGRIMLAFDFMDASQNGKQDGMFIDVVPNERLSYTWPADSVPTTVAFALSEDGGETRVSLDHWTDQEGADEKKLHDHHADQWKFFMMNLKGYLEAGIDARAEKLSQMTG